MIKRFITSDRRVGYDEFGQLTLITKDGNDTVSTFIKDVRGKICAICLRGWEPTGESMSDQVHWQLLDDYVHETCSVRFRSLNDRMDFHNAIALAKIKHKGLVPIENKYWPKSYKISQSPWYKTTLTEHPVELVIGWRKRVVSIELSIEAPGVYEFQRDVFKELFSKEDVTKEFESDKLLIHAWSLDKTREYLQTLGVGLRTDGIKEADR